MWKGFKSVWLVLGYALTTIIIAVPKTLTWPLLKLFGLLNKPDNVHGDAHWATRKEIKSAGFYGTGLILAKAYDKYIRMSSPLHVLAFGATGSGKTRGLIVPNLLELERSMLVVDPKGGELSKLTEGHRAGFSKIVKMTLNNPVGCPKYDPLLAVKRAGKYELEDECLSLAQLIIPSSKEPKENHFRSLAQKIIVGAVAYYVTKEPQKAVLPDILNKLTAMSPARLRDEMARWSKNSNLPIVSGAVEAYNRAGDNEKGSFSTTLYDFASPFMTSSAREIFRGDGFDWVDVIETPTTVYVQYPIHRSEVYGAIVRLIVGQACDAIMSKYDKEGALKRPFTIVVDEASRMGYCHTLAKAVTYLRGANANIMCAFQSPAQIANDYPDARTFMDNFEAWVISRIGRDVNFARQISDIIGDATIESGSHSHSDHGKSEGKRETARKLAKPEELRQLPDDECIVLVGSLTIKANKAFDFNNKAMVRKIKAGKKRMDERWLGH